MRRTTFVLLALACAPPAPAQSTEARADVNPRPRDVTLETLADPAALRALQTPGKVLFEDDFESSESLAKYFEIRGRDEGRARRVEGEELAHRGCGAMRFDAPAAEGSSSGSGASSWLGAKGYDRVYFRRYIRFADDYDQGNLNHTGGGLAAVAGKGKWDGMGKAGVRPRGDDRFTCGFEPWRDPWRDGGRHAAPGAMSLYTYWVDMERDKDGNWWGNLFQPARERRRVPERGEWVCLEQMITANTPGAADGELAAWIDGELYLHMKGFRWRTDERVKLKRFDIGIYVHRAVRENTVWYDDVAVSTGYLGPLASK
ncbi:MAG: hypothetical protein GY711_27970 [bacterium]|nr:hypothetical protein [bacterium]